jgi:hypothetical protein
LTFRSGSASLSAGKKVLQLPESGHHDEVLQSVVAHNARRRAQRSRAARRHHRFSALAGTLGLLAACGVGAYLIMVVGSSLFGGHTTKAPAAAPTPPASTTRAAPKQSTAERHIAVAATAKVKKTAKVKAKGHQPATATIASISTKKRVTHHVTVATRKTTPKRRTPTAGAPAVVLAETDAAKGTRNTSLEATIPAPGVATFTIAATRGSAYVEVRLQTATGPLLNKGTIPKGETISFSNKVLWVKVRAPALLDLSVNGKTWRPKGSTVTATLTPTGVS